MMTSSANPASSPGSFMGASQRVAAFQRELHSEKTFVVMNRMLDSGCTGPLFLRKPEIAGTVRDAIRYRERICGISGSSRRIMFTS
jgi:hypothetical protein